MKLTRRNERIALKAASIASDGLQTLLEQRLTSLSPDGTLSFFDIFGTSYAKLYEKNSALRSVVDFLAINTAGCHIKVSDRDENGATRPLPDHPVQRLLEHPQDGVPYSRLMRAVVADKAIYDVAALWKIRETFDPTPDSQGRITNRGTVSKLIRIPIPRISMAQTSLTSPLMFNVSTGLEPVKVPPEDIIWMHGYSPSSNIAGVPPVETLRQVLAEEWAAGKNQENRWKNGPQADVVFLQDTGSQGLVAEQAETFKTSWRNKYGGVSASNAREWPLLPPGITPREIVIDAAASEYLATRVFAREEVCHAYGILPQLLGITPSNYATMDMVNQLLYQNTLSPWMTSIQEELEEQLLREFESVESSVHLDFNINAKLAGSFLEQAKIGQQAVGGPWMTRNEFREKFQGLPPVEGGDDIIVPLNVVLGGGPQANPQDSTNQFNAEILPDGVVRLWPRQEGTP